MKGTRMKGKNTLTKILVLSAHFLCSSSLFSAGYSWAIDTTGKCLFRNSTDASSPWTVDTSMTLPATYIGTGHTGETWALVAETVPATSNIWYRSGITAANLKGTGWTNIGGILASLSIGYNGRLVGVNSAKSAFFRNGLNGTWISLGEGFLQLAIGPTGAIWAIKPDQSVWIRTGITDAVPQGTGWLQTDGALNNISIGQGGVLYGAQNSGYIYKRLNITSSNPAGSGWQRISTTPFMAVVSASQNSSALWAIDSSGKYYSWSGTAWTQITN